MHSFFEVNKKEREKIRSVEKFITSGRLKWNENTEHTKMFALQVVFTLAFQLDSSVFELHLTTSLK